MKINHHHFKGIQNIHSRPILRIGGIFIFLSLLLINLFYSFDLYFKLILYSFIPVFALLVIEDLFKSISIKIRLILPSIVIFIFLNNLDIYPKLFLIEFLGRNINYFYPLFYTFASLSIINAFNILDGLNGNCSFCFLSILISLIILANKYLIFVNELDFIIFFLIIALFIFFNFPKARFFLGDAGSYFFGFFTSLYVIIFFAKYDFINPLYAILILIYPITEMIYTFCRRLINKTSLFSADFNHLHSYVYLINKKNRIHMPNAKSQIYLCFFYLYPVFCTFIFQHTYEIIFAIIIYIFIYIYIYNFLKSNLSKS